MTSQRIEFFFDIGSPYSYLAATQIPDLEEETGVPVDWRPFLLGGVFKEVGNRPPAQIQEKGVYMLKDLNRWADFYEEPFQMNSHFPINSLLAQRALVAAKQVDEGSVEDLAMALYRDYWTEDVDVSTPEAVGAAAGRVGLDAEKLLAATDTQAVKDQLRDNSDEAVDRGAFGAPTFFVGGEMFWGNDRMFFVEQAAKGT
jgi:2-hydroxychromene-2-carboxylate isomerase